MDNMPNRNDQDGRFEQTHGLTAHPFYPIWKAMTGRCENTNDQAYDRYGARGITVCDEWHDPSVFIAWLESNGYKKGLQLDREDNDKGYSPDNCRVVTRQENCRNRRDNVRYMVHGESLLAVEVEQKYGVKEMTFRARVDRYGQTPEQAIVNKRKLPQYEWEIDGRMMSAKEVSAEFGINANTFLTRVNRGWPAQRAAMTPVGG